MTAATMKSTPTKKEAVRHLIDYCNAMAELIERRNQLIINAYEAKVPMSHVAALVGLTRARCYQIYNGG